MFFRAMAGKGGPRKRPSKTLGGRGKIARISPDDVRLLTVSFSNEEHGMIDKAANALGQTKARFARRAIFAELRRLGHKPPPDY